MKKILLIILILISCTGCLNYNELDDLGIVSLIHIDYQDNYKIYVETLKNDKNIKHEGTGTTIPEAIKNIQDNSNEKLYYQHINIIVITPNVKLDDLYSYIERTPNFNNNYFLAISSNKDIDNGESLKKLLSNNKEDNIFKNIKNSKEKLIYYIPNIDNEKIINYYVIKNNNILDTLSVQEKGILDLLNNKNKELVINNLKNTVSINNIKVKEEIHNNKITYKINSKITIESTLDYIDTLQEKYILDIQNTTSSNIKKQIKELLIKGNIKDIDYLNINNKLYNKYHNEEKTYKDYKYEITIDTKITKKGIYLK